MSRVDVIVPCHNYGRFLGQCVQSVLTQEQVELRVLILDDASTDESEMVGRDLAAGDDRIEYRRHAVNRGHIDTFNEGIEWSRGNYCLLLSADDVLTPGALGRTARLMDDNPEVGLTFGPAYRTDAPGAGDHGQPQTYHWRVLPGYQFIEMACEQGGNFVHTPTAVVRTSVQRRIGGYRKELPHTADMEMW